MSSEPSQVTPGQPVLVDQIAQVVLATSGVHGLHAGTTGVVATYLPGRRVAGIRAVDGGHEVHVVLVFGASVYDTAQAVRAAVQTVTPGRVDVSVEDVVSVLEVGS